MKNEVYTEISGAKIDLHIDYDAALGFVTGKYGNGFRASVNSTTPGLLMIRCGSVFSLTWPKQTQTITCDLYTAFIFPAKFSFDMQASSSFAEFALFFPSPQLIEDTANVHSLDTNKIIKVFSEPALLRRTNWFNEIMHRFIFEKITACHKTPEATIFLQREIIKEAFYRATEINNAMKTLLDLDDKGFTARDSTLKKAIAFIESHLFQTFSVTELAKAAGASESTLLRMFEREFSKSPRKYILERRLEESFQLIKSKRYSIGEIGFMIGYESPSAFSRAFKEKFGKTPTEMELDARFN